MRMRLSGLITTLTGERYAELLFLIIFSSNCWSITFLNAFCWLFGIGRIFCLNGCWSSLLSSILWHLFTSDGVRSPKLLAATESSNWSILSLSSSRVIELICVPSFLVEVVQEFDLLEFPRRCRRVHRYLSGLGR